MNDIPLLEIHSVSKSFDEGRIVALADVSLEVREGEFISITGPSGCGKSTLLHLIAALDRPDGGTIRMGKLVVSEGRNLDAYRANEVGVIFQLHNLLPSFTAIENVQLPMFETSLSHTERVERASELLDAVGLQGKYDQRPAELSGGERQRVAIARSLANQPRMLLADEPTGSLDSVAGQQVLDLLEHIREERSLTIILVSHDAAVAQRAERTVKMLDGRIVDDARRERPPLNHSKTEAESRL